MASYSNDIYSDNFGIGSENEIIGEDRFSELANNEFLSDVTFLVGRNQKIVPAHRVILSTCSWDFYNVFKNVKLDQYVLPIEDVEYTTFVCFMNYCYSRKIVLDDTQKQNPADNTLSEDEADKINPLDLLKLARRFHMKQLIRECESHLYGILSKGTCLATSLTVYSETTLLKSFLQFRERILAHITSKFMEIILCEKTLQIFFNLTLDHLHEITKFNFLGCDEMQLFDALMKWAKHNCLKYNILVNSKNLRLILAKVFYNICFGDMKLEWFNEILMKYEEMFTHKEISNIIRMIRGETGVNSKFSHSLRYSVLFFKQPENLPVGKNLVHCSTKLLALSTDTSRDFSLKFQIQCNLKLRGFAFIHKKDQNVKILSCKIHRESDEDKNKPIYALNDLEASNTFTLNWDYCLSLVHFPQDFLLDKNERGTSWDWNVIHCNLNEKVPLVKSNLQTYTKEITVKGVYIRRNEGPYGEIPYLIFE